MLQNTLSREEVEKMLEALNSLNGAIAIATGAHLPGELPREEVTLNSLNGAIAIAT